MAKSKKSAKSAGKGFSGSNVITGAGSSLLTRRQFLGTAVTGAGAAAMGLGGVAKAQAPPVEPLILTPEYPAGVFHEVRIYRDETHEENGEIVIGYGIPFIYSDTNYGLFYGLGYATAQDRMVQCEMYVRAGRGRLAELVPELPPSQLGITDALIADVLIRSQLVPYTEEELQQQFESLSSEVQQILTAYVNGFNTYLYEALDDPYNKLPFEYFALGKNPFMLRDGPNGNPRPPGMNEIDLLAYMVFTVALSEADGEEYNNAKLLEHLTAALGPAGYTVFNDFKPFDDPEAFTTIPTVQGRAALHRPPKMETSMEQAMPFGVEFTIPSTRDLKNMLKKIGISVQLGSYGIAFHNSLTSNFKSLLIGAPQSGVTEIPHPYFEYQLMGGENGIEVRGATWPLHLLMFASYHTDKLASTITSGTGDNNDYYADFAYVDDPTNPSMLTAYLFDSDYPHAEEFPLQPTPRPFETRLERIYKADGTSIDVALYRTVHGPVIPDITDPEFKPLMLPLPVSCESDADCLAPQVCQDGRCVPEIDVIVITRKMATWMQEYQMFERGWALMQAENVQEAAASYQLPPSPFNHNGLFVDSVGNIGYRFAGIFPNRQSYEIADPRLPVPGLGDKEWVGTTYKVDSQSGTLTWEGGTYPYEVSVVNPSQGYLFNWNSKPCVDVPYGALGSGVWFKGRSHDHIIDKNIREILTTNRKFSKADAKSLLMEIAKGATWATKYDEDGERAMDMIPNNLEYYKQYLLKALNTYPSTHPTIAGQAEAVLVAWDGDWYESAVDPDPELSCGGTDKTQAGWTIMSEWFIRMTDRLFAPIFGPFGPSNPDGTLNLYKRHAGAVLTHLLDHRVGSGSSVPPVYDYFNGQDPNEVIVEVFDEVLEVLENMYGSDPFEWQRDRQTYALQNLLKMPFGTQYRAERASNEMLVYMGVHALEHEAENLFNIGQSNFLSAVPQPGWEMRTIDLNGDGIPDAYVWLHPHYFDMNPLYKCFDFKPMNLIEESEW